MADIPLTYGQIARQVMVTFTETAVAQRSFTALVAELQKILEGVRYRFIAQEEVIRLVALEVVPPDTATGVLAILEKSDQARKITQAAEQNRPLQSFAPPAVDDPRYHEQWALHRVGAEAAWAHALGVIDLGATGIPVAILDTGIDPAHPDLSPHLWDDGSGKHGVNVLTGSSDVFDSDGHGTLLAGTVGAVSNNATGIAAAGWPIQLMAVKFHDIQNPPSALNATLAILHAISNRASIIVAAWGIPFPHVAVELAINLAGLFGVLVVAAAGNDGVDNDVLPTYPASFKASNLVSVMASDLDDEKAGFSNYGLQRVHLAAPGVDILSTDTSVDLTTPRYREYTGTSAACALVAYAAALLKTMNPSWTPTEMREHLIASVEPNPWLYCQARGRLSLALATMGPFSITSPAMGARWKAGSRVAVTWTNRYQTPRAARVEVQLSVNGGKYTTLDTGQNNGSLAITVPTAKTTSARIRVRAEHGPGLFAQSAPFTIE
jgi:subtilisin family serine protease